jgi:hypothetical protein
MAFSRMLGSLPLLGVSLQTRRLLPGEAISWVAGGLPSRLRTAARNDIAILK